MRVLALLGALAVTASTVRARADDALAPTAPAAPGSQAPADDSAVLHAELARQAAAIDALRTAIEAEKRAREDARRETESAVHVSGYAQVDWVIHDQMSQNEINGSTGQLLNQDRFTLRRGHVRVEADRGLVGAALEIDANTTSGPQVRPIDAEVWIRWPEKPDDKLPSLALSAGLMQIPFGFEVQELDNVRPFLERSTVMQALYPGAFDLGAKLKTTYKFLVGSLALMNGSPIGDLVFPDLDPVHAKDVVGRLGVDVEVVPGVRFLAGVSGDTGTGFHAGTPTTKYVVIWQDQNGDGIVEPNELTAVGGVAATPSETFHRWAIAGDARLVIRMPRLGDLAFRAEVVRSLNLDRGLEYADPVEAGHDLRELGWYVGATQEITPYGLVGVRFDSYDPNDDAMQQRALNLVPISRRYTTLALLAMLRCEPARARLSLEYDVNTNPLGIASNGAPTSLADNALTLRGQVSF